MELIWKIVIAILIIFILYLLSLRCKTYVENFKIQDRPKEPMLVHLEEQLAPMFAENVKYEGILQPILTKQMKRKILNEITLSKGKKSYTINKQNIYMCLKDQQNEYYDKNMLLHVIIHEIAHILTVDEIGHTPKFNKILDALLEKATEMNIYNPNIPLIRDYCTFEDEI